MSHAESDGNAKVPCTGEPSEANFTSGLKKAEMLLKHENYDGALELLSRLQAQYIDAVRIFDLMGDVLLKQGNTKEGIRFKTLHEVVKGTFRIVQEEISLADLRLSGQRASSAGEPQELAGDRRDEEDLEYFPLTESVAKECVRQGHFDRAVAVLTRLLRDKPGDPALLAAVEEARKKQKGKQLLKVFQQWLDNIEQMKTGRAAGA
jgi:predicted Zn-dependent protease